MSLSSHLDDKNSPIRRFLSSQFSNHRAFLNVARRQMRQAEILMPPVPGASYPYPTIGTAIDYRLRYYFRVTPIREFVAYHAAVTLQGNWSIPRNSAYGSPVIVFDESSGKELAELRSIDGIGRTIRLPIETAHEYKNAETFAMFSRNLDTLTSEICTVGQRLEEDKENELNRYCYVLALLEQIFRVGPSINSPLLERKFMNVDELLGIPPRNCITDLCNLSWTFYDNFKHLLSLPHILNPNFEGSLSIPGGADADLIVDGTLIDIKTTKKREIDRDWLWQLMGYVLLDYSDKHKIRGIGLYMARQCLFIRWSMKEVLAFLFKGKPKSLEQLRGEFKETVKSLSEPV